MTKNGNKRPKSKNIPKVEKAPLSGTFSDEYISWRFANICSTGNFGWNIIDEITIFGDLMDKVKCWETMKMHEILGDRDHQLVQSSISNAGRKAMEEFIPEEFHQNVASFHIGKKRRIIGFITGNIFNVVLWDPKHNFAPSKMKHT